MYKLLYISYNKNRTGNIYDFLLINRFNFIYIYTSSLLFHKFMLQMIIYMLVYILMLYLEGDKFMKNIKQRLYIYMDDSGKLNRNETSCVFGGLFFYSSNEINNFINQYRAIIKKIKCFYCNNDISNCNKNCIEIKGTTKLNKSHRRWIYNLNKKYNNFGVFIDNNKIYSNIINDKSARGRFLDYAQKRIIKEILLYSINIGKINPNKELELYIKIDQADTKSNGYYNLKDSIYEELVNGIINFDYSIVREPILKNKLCVSVVHYNSKYNYGIQAADMVANYLHRHFELKLNKDIDIENDINFIEVKLYLP